MTPLGHAGPSVLAGFRLLLDPAAPLRASRRRHATADPVMRAWADVFAAANAQITELRYSDRSERDGRGVYFYPHAPGAYDPPPVFLRPLDLRDWSTKVDALAAALAADSFAIVDLSQIPDRDTELAIQMIDELAFTMRGNVHRGNHDMFRVLPHSKTWVAANPSATAEMGEDVEDPGSGWLRGNL